MVGCQAKKVKRTSSPRSGIRRVANGFKTSSAAAVGCATFCGGAEAVVSLKSEMVPVLETAAQISPRPSCG